MSDLNEAINSLVRQAYVAQTKYTEAQLVEVFRQMLLAGDFVFLTNLHPTFEQGKMIQPGQVIYTPYYREKELQAQIAGLKSRTAELTLACKGALTSLLLGEYVDKDQAISFLKEVLAKDSPHDERRAD